MKFAPHIMEDQPRQKSMRALSAGVTEDRPPARTSTRPCSFLLKFKIIEPKITAGVSSPRHHRQADCLLRDGRHAETTRS